MHNQEHEIENSKIKNRQTKTVKLKNQNHITTKSIIEKLRNQSRKINKPKLQNCENRNHKNGNPEPLIRKLELQNQDLISN